MKNKFCFIGLLFALLWVNTSLLVAKNRYQTDILANMAESLKLSSKLDTLKDGCYKSEFSYKQRPLNVCVHNGKICHIGYVLFSDQQRQAFKSPVCNFLERYTLAADLPLERKKTISRQLLEDDMNFAKGTFATITKLIGDTTLNVTVDNLNNKRYKVSWSKKEELYCSVDFPIGYDLLHGTEMNENERRIVEEILHTPLPAVQTVQVKRDQLLTTWQPNYFILPGESYYVDQLNTNRYYEKVKDGQFKLMFNQRYPLETLANLFTTLELENEFQLSVCLKKYDFNEDNFNVPLSQFVSYFLQQGCVPYFGVMSYEKTIAVCQLVMRNADEGYCHTMKVTFDVEQLSDKKGKVTVRVNSYVPTSKINFLFEEFKM